jgi:Restriction endonuclease NaeI
VLGHQDNDPLVAAALGLPVPKKGEFISAWVVPARDDRDDPVAAIDGGEWALGRLGDPVVAAPVVPRTPTAPVPTPTATTPTATTIPAGTHVMPNLFTGITAPRSP